MRMKEIHVCGEHMQPREGQGRPVLGNPCVGNTLQWLLSFHTYGVMRAGIAFFHLSCRFSMRMEQIARRRRTVRARWLFLHTHGAHPYTPLSDAWRTVLLHAHGAHREKFARPDSGTAVSPHTEPQQMQFAGLCRCITYNYLKLFKTIFCGLKNG